MNQQTALERRVANLEKMIQISRALRSAFDLSSLLQQITEAIVELADCERSSIFLLDNETGELRFGALSGPEPELESVQGLVIPRHSSIAGSVFDTREPLVVHDVRGDPRFFGRVDQATGLSTKSILGVPLEIGGRIIGVLEAMNKKPGQIFDSEDVETLLMFASQAAAAIENTRLIEEQRERLTEVLLLQDVLQTLSRFIRKTPLLEQLLALLAESLGYADCAVWMFDREADALRLAAYRGLGNADLLGRLVPTTEDTVVGRAATWRDPVTVADVNEGNGLGTLSPTTRSMLAVPMPSSQDADLVGVISLESPQVAAFGKRDVRLLGSIATQAAIGVRQAQLYEDSQRANQLKQEFIATMSHELRTPMTVIIGYCDMLSKGALGALAKPQLDALSVMHDRSEVLLGLLNDVIDLSKIVAGELKLYSTSVDLRRTAEAVAEKYRAQAERKSQTISVAVSSDGQYVSADAQRVRHILEHLVQNAIKFSPDGRPVVVRACPHDGGYVRTDVIDQGIGIKPENREVIFEDFRQLDGSFTREYGGAGIGLAISKHLVELQGGLIWVESEFGKGSTFSFILPRASSPSDEPTSPTAASPALQ